MECNFVLIRLVGSLGVYRCTRCGFITPPIKNSKIHHHCSNPNGTVKDTVAPGIVSQAKHYISAVMRWREAGYPVRTDDEVETIFREKCSCCHLYSEIKGICTHSECGCLVRSPNSSKLANAARAIGVTIPIEAMVNKLRMATEHCPENKW